MTPTHRLIIAGTRTYTPTVEEIDHATLEWLDRQRPGEEVCSRMIACIISGAARGVDKAGERWAELRGIPVERYPADWSKGKVAGKLRNIEMAKVATGLIAFWDGMSPGTAHMIAIAVARGLHVVVRRTG